MAAKYKSLEELIETLNGVTVAGLREIANEFGVIPGNRKRAELIDRIIAVYKGELPPEERKKSGRPRKGKEAVNNEEPVITAEQQTPVDSVDPSLPRTGILEIMDGYGFVRTHNYSNTSGKDYYITANMVSRMKLVSGDKLRVALRQYPDRQAPTAVYVEEINDEPCSEIHRTPFDALEPCFPNQRINLRTEKTDYSLRVLDLVAPIGKGQRGLIVAPPKTGKTILLKKLAMAVAKNHPEIHQ